MLELEREKRAKEAARKAEDLRLAAQEAKRNYACLLLSKEVRFLLYFVCILEGVPRPLCRGNCRNMA